MDAVTKSCRCPVCDAAFHAWVTLGDLLSRPAHMVTRSDIRNAYAVIEDALNLKAQHGDLDATKKALRALIEVSAVSQINANQVGIGPEWSAAQEVLKGHGDSSGAS